MNKQNIILGVVFTGFSSMCSADYSLGKFAEHVITGAITRTATRATEHAIEKEFGAQKTKTSRNTEQAISNQNNASPTLCSANYLNGKAPHIFNEKLNIKAQAICYPAFALMHSGITRTPLWSANHLTADRIASSCQMKRQDAFHPDPNLATDVRSELSDYTRSGFDRGHLVPSFDAPTPNDQADTFTLANMIPQLHANNAGIWEQLESGARNLAVAGHDVYVVSGPLFEGATIKQLQGRVMVPTSVFKAIYDTTTHKSAVYITPNSAEQTFKVASINDFMERIGFDPFPAGDESVKNIASDIIKPAKKTNCK